MSEQGTNLGIADYQERPDLSGPRRIPASASVLVIDDEPGVRNFLERALVRHFRHVRVAANVKEAEAAREEGHYDLIISDIRLPGVSGVDWVEAVRAQGDPTDVIFITAYADLETAIAALRAGASDFILKPFRMDQLYTAIDRCFERRSMQRRISYCTGSWRPPARRWGWWARARSCSRSASCSAAWPWHRVRC